MCDYLSSDLLTPALFTSKNRVIMASNEATSRNEPEPVRLTESDIPGAKLTCPIDSYTVTESVEMVATVSWRESADLMEQETTHFKVYYCTM